MEIKGRINKIHSNFYYVKAENQLYECMLREIIKKEKQSVFVGDTVKLEEINHETNQAVITEVFDRNNYIPRPSIANIDQIVIVCSVKKPVLDYIQLNRYLTHAGIYQIPVVICINKSDLVKDRDVIEQVLNIYEPLGYKIIFTSAKSEEGVENFKNALKDKVSVLCGASGVGKSSLLNTISPNLALKIGKISNKSKRGTHTTRHTEIIELIDDNENAIAEVADTPGFSYLKFDNILPDDVDDYFTDIKKLANECKYADCLHIHEDGCNVKANMEELNPIRYDSYKIFVEEAKEYKQKLTFSGHKVEENSKIIDSQDNEKIKIVKLGINAREKSRKHKKQKLNPISILDDTYYNND